MDGNIPKTGARKWLTANNAFNLLIAVVTCLLLFVPSAKALFIRGLMQVGLFQPIVEKATDNAATVGNVTFKDVNGKELSLSSLKGKVVLVNFWATWCPPCIAELPSLNELHKQLANNADIVFLFVDVDGDLKKSALFADKHQLQLPLYIAISNIPESLSGNTIPTTVVIDKRGKLVFRHDGAADYTNHKFVAFLNKLSKD